MLPRSALSAFSALRIGNELSVQHGLKSYSSHSRSDADEADLEAARAWFGGLGKSTIPVKIGVTSFARSSGPGGQKVNKTDSKAMTTWPMHALLRHIPKVLHKELRASRYYVSSSDSISIHCDTERQQMTNKNKTHERLLEEITRIYKKTVPGVTSQKKKQHVSEIENLSTLGLRYHGKEARQYKLQLKQALKAKRLGRSANFLKGDKTAEKYLKTGTSNNSPHPNITQDKSRQCCKTKNEKDAQQQEACQEWWRQP